MEQRLQLKQVRKRPTRKGFYHTEVSDEDESEHSESESESGSDNSDLSTTNQQSKNPSLDR